MRLAVFLTAICSASYCTLEWQAARVWQWPPVAGSRRPGPAVLYFRLQTLFSPFIDASPHPRGLRRAALTDYSKVHSTPAHFPVSTETGHQLCVQTTHHQMGCVTPMLPPSRLCTHGILRVQSYKCRYLTAEKSSRLGTGLTKLTTDLDHSTTPVMHIPLAALHRRSSFVVTVVIFQFFTEIEMSVLK